VSRCPFAEVRNPVWRAAVELSRFADVAPLQGLTTDWTAAVGYMVLAYREAIVVRRIELANERAARG
jgi:hypothetical protein